MSDSLGYNANNTHGDSACFYDSDFTTAMDEVHEFLLGCPALSSELESEHDTATMLSVGPVGLLPEEFDGVRLVESGSTGILKVCARGSVKDVASLEGSIFLPVYFDFTLELRVVTCHSASPVTCCSLLGGT